MRNNQQVLSDALTDNLAMAEDRAHIGLTGQTMVRGVAASAWCLMGSLRGLALCIVHRVVRHATPVCHTESPFS